MRGAVTKKKNSKPLIVWFPDPLIAGLDQGVVVCDLDRSKFIRAAVREKLDRVGTGNGR
jgi:hypothetical protein